jgi:hypothetical protein
LILTFNLKDGQILTKKMEGFGDEVALNAELDPNVLFNQV